MQCAAGKYNAGAGVGCLSCLAGQHGSTAGLVTAACSGPCTAGYACAAGSISPTASICVVGTYSLAGAAVCSNCPAGTFGSTQGLTSAVCSGGCTAGYACPAGSTSATSVQCPLGWYSLAGAGVCTACPPGTYGATAGLTTAACSGICAAGRFGANTNQTASACDGACLVEYTCAAGSTDEYGAPTAVQRYLHSWALVTPGVYDVYGMRVGTTKFLSSITTLAYTGANPQAGITGGIRLSNPSGTCSFDIVLAGGAVTATLSSNTGTYASCTVAPAQGTLMLNGYGNQVVLSLSVGLATDTPVAASTNAWNIRTLTWTFGKSTVVKYVGTNLQATDAASTTGNSASALWVYTSGTVTTCKVGLWVDSASGQMYARFPPTVTGCTVTFAANTLVAMNTVTQMVVVNAGPLAITSAAMPATTAFTPAFTTTTAVHTRTLNSPTGVVAFDYSGVNARTYTAGGMVVGPDTNAISATGCALTFSINAAGQLVVASANGLLAAVSATPFTCTYSLASGSLTVTTSAGTVYQSNAITTLTFAPTAATLTYTKVNSNGGTLTYLKTGDATNARISWMSMSPALGELDYAPVLLSLFGSPSPCRIVLSLRVDGKTIDVVPSVPTGCSVTLAAASYVVVVASVDAVVGSYSELLKVTTDVAISFP